MDEEGNIVNKGDYHKMISNEQLKKMYDTMVTINEADVVFNQA
jgi:ABC-type enterochelin transport system ATPase subunit